VRILGAILAVLAGASAGFAAAATGSQGPSGGTGLGGGTTTAAHHSAPPPATQAGFVPLDGRAMWIWELASVDGGKLAPIIAGARTHGVHTLIIKSSDGSGMWAQFTPALVHTLHASGLRVCAWQYVYGIHPIYEAQAGAQAVKDGADCLVIDAEVEYDGRYEEAQAYMRELRRLIGYKFPLALAGLPYVDYHPAFPYSVFLGLGGAQYDMPQMYWAEIGTSVDGVYAHTYLFNRPYNRPIFPLGQVYNDPPARQIRRFRAVSESYGAAGVSWWDWGDTSAGSWGALSTPVAEIDNYEPAAGMATLGEGATGDLVVWAQEHLVSAGQRVAIDGSFGPKTLAAVKSFQRAHDLAATGLIDTTTWAALLRYRAAHIVWTKRAVVAGARRGPLTPLPQSASLPDKRDEIAGAGGAGGAGGPRGAGAAAGAGHPPR
jgi:hypothetical protein